MKQQNAKWNEETQSGTYSDKIHHGEMKRGWDKNPVLGGEPKEDEQEKLWVQIYNSFDDYTYRKDWLREMKSKYTLTPKK